ncbi:MAG: acyltransferase [Betaproteobacteria bacterium]|nr:acyltransferase [Betaproteobacteria bacterium]
MGLGGALLARIQVDDAALGGRNNFHLIRLGAALLVLLAHCFHLLGRAGEEPIGRWFVWLDASVLGVATFFLVSGLLVARSWDLRRDLARFLAARALRIVPALWLALALSVFCLGPALTALPLADYFRNAGTAGYLLWNAVLRPQYLLPGVFEANPVPGVNGSLWTIPLEVVMYAILGIAGWLGFLAPRHAVAAVRERMRPRPLAGAALLLLASALAVKVLWTGAQYYTLAGYFLLGVLCYRLRHLWRWRLVHAALLAVIAVAAARTWAGPLLLPVAIAGAILTLALHPSLRMPMTWWHRHDYSYGTYLYGFPVQQALIACGVREPLLLFICAVPLTLGCAAVSWHLVERPALARKAAAGDWIAAWLSRDSHGA